MSTDQIKIKDTCVCGAVFSIDGWNEYARNHHTNWLNAHNICRVKTSKNSLLRR